LPSLKHLLKQGFISFDDNGSILISAQLSTTNKNILNINNEMHLNKVNKNIKKYLDFHRKNIFI
jgi:hypothetical protein